MTELIFGFNSLSIPDRTKVLQEIRNCLTYGEYSVEHLSFDVLRYSFNKKEDACLIKLRFGQYVV